MEIKRKIYNVIKTHLEKPEITLIVGPRQAGKTTIAKKLQAELRAASERTLFLNLDIESDYSIIESQEKLLFAIKNQVGEERAYVFIDEFQRKSNSGRFLKGIYDMNLPYKFIITGSVSIELKEEVHESLAGRKRIFEINTLSFEEYFDYETKYEFENKLAEFAQIYPERVILYLQNYMTFGGYPKLAITAQIDEKRLLLQEIYNSYLIKDVTALLKIEKTEAFQKLIQNLSILNGKLVNLSKLSSSIGIATQTLEKYLWYLEKTYIISICRPFSRNPLKEINKSYIIYFNDLGLRSLIAGNFIEPSLRTDYGFDFQNYTFLTLKDLLQDKQPILINFWRSKESAEVDFVIKNSSSFIPIECKYSNLKAPEIAKSVRSFINQYKPAYCFILNKDFEESNIIDNTQVMHIPFYYLQNINKYI